MWRAPAAVAVPKPIAPLVLTATGAMRYSIDVGYPSSSALVPSSFTMTITRQSNGAKVTLHFTNVDGGGPNGTAERTRGTDFLTANGCN